MKTIFAGQKAVLKGRGYRLAECSGPCKRVTRRGRASLGGFVTRQDLTRAESAEQAERALLFAEASSSFGFVTGHDLSPADQANQINGALAPEGNQRRTLRAFALLLAFLATVVSAQAQKPVWRQATDAELSALLPARAPVEKEHIETESSTASGITDGKGHFIAGIVLITAGYSADGKYSHYLIVQSPMSVDGIRLASGEYVFGYSRNQEDGLDVRLYEALTGKPVGTAKATRIPGAGMVKSLRILPPGEKPLIQIGRFGIPYELLDR